MCTCILCVYAVCHTYCRCIVFCIIVWYNIHCRHVQYVNDLFVEGGLVVLVNRSMPALWLLTLPIDCVLGEAEGVCMLISFRRWFYTNTQNTGKNIHRECKVCKDWAVWLNTFVTVTVEQDGTEHFLI